jgi:hypothetical protein
MLSELGLEGRSHLGFFSHRARETVSCVGAAEPSTCPPFLIKGGLTATSRVRALRSAGGGGVYRCVRGIQLEARAHVIPGCGPTPAHMDRS